MKLEELHEAYFRVLKPALLTTMMGRSLTVPDVRMIYAVATVVLQRRTKLQDQFVIEEIQRTTDDFAGTRAVDAQVLGQFNVIVRGELERDGANPAAENDQQDVATTGAPSRGDRVTTPKAPTTRTFTILFMDLSGWSKLTAPVIASYLEKGLPALGEEIKKHNPALLNTWGDAIVAAFDSAAVAAECALDIKDFFARRGYKFGIPAAIFPRIALNTGEAIIAFNPLIERYDLFGDAVHLAARLEPATVQGEVF